MIIILSCGKKKARSAQPARTLYTGPYYRACLHYALKLAPASSIYILSAKYGLVSLTDRLEPYELKMGAPGSVTVAQIQAQCELLSIPAGEPVIVLGGKKYARFCAQVFEQVRTPLAGRGGLWEQVRWLRQEAGYRE